MLIAIVAAMEEEITPLKSKIQPITSEIIGGFEFHRGSIYGKELILLKSGIGKVNTAIGTALLLKLFKPDYVINTGSAGGFNLDLNIGDIIVSDKVCHHDVDLSAFGYDLGQLPQLPTYFLPDDKLVKTTVAHLNRLDNVPYHLGMIASGDRFVHDENDVASVKEKFPDIMACEMEAAAVAQTCHQFCTPFVVIRAISDIPGKKNVIAFETFLSQAVQTYTKFLLSMLEDR